MSTDDFLNCLLEGDYFFVIDWHAFLLKENKLIDIVSDEELTTQFVGELCTHEMTKDHFYHMEIIFVMCDSLILEPEIERLLMCLVNAGMRLDVTYRATCVLTSDEIDLAIENKKKQLDKKNFGKEIGGIYQAIMDLDALKKECNKYSEILNNQDSEKYEQRKGVWSALMASLETERMLTPRIKRQVTDYIATIKQLNPTLTETDCLNKILPETFVEQVTNQWSFFAAKAITYLYSAVIENRPF